MKVSHAELERCRADPLAWVEHRLGVDGGDTFLRRGFQAALRDAICHYHKTSSVSRAHSALAGYLKKFSSSDRKQATQNALDNYVYWHKSSGVIVAQCRIRLAQQIGPDVFLGGEITRLDVNPDTGRYAAVLLGASQAFDGSELRWPLIQRAISDQFGRPADLFDVGVQDFSGTPLILRSYSPAELADAADEGAELASEIGKAIVQVTGDAG